MQKELIRTLNEVILTILDEDKDNVEFLKKEAEEQAQINGLSLQIFSNKTIAFTFRGAKEGLQKVYQYYFLE